MISPVMSFRRAKGPAESIREYKYNQYNSFRRNFFINRIIPTWKIFPFDLEQIRTVTNLQENLYEFYKR